MLRSELDSDDYNSYYQPYIDKVEDIELLDALKRNRKSVASFIKSIDINKLSFRYAEGKWSVKEIILHLIDTERVFAYRALCIARNDKTELPGFDQDVFVSHGYADNRSIEDLLSEYETVRMATISLFTGFNHEVLAARGIANNSSLSVRATAFIIVGHENHHLQIIKERYL
ncbi:MAG: DinB family protein [Gelidibacter sp.]|uniref:DinB family protein n=1 Tax=Gelidibacter sp. TaxID=2018083 RepID=UPI00326467F3